MATGKIEQTVNALIATWPNDQQESVPALLLGEIHLVGSIETLRRAVQYLVLNKYLGFQPDALPLLDDLIGLDELVIPLLVGKLRKTRDAYGNYLKLQQSGWLSLFSIHKHSQCGEILSVQSIGSYVVIEAQGSEIYDEVAYFGRSSQGFSTLEECLISQIFPKDYVAAAMKLREP